MRQWIQNQRSDATAKNNYGLEPQADAWEVAHKSLNIDFTNPIGKGAFSIVYSGTDIAFHAVRAANDWWSKYRD